jgi:hypothetical protein
MVPRGPERCSGAVVAEGREGADLLGGVIRLPLFGPTRASAGPLRDGTLVALGRGGVARPLGRVPPRPLVETSPRTRSLALGRAALPGVARAAGAARVAGDRSGLVLVAWRGVRLGNPAEGRLAGASLVVHATETGVRPTVGTARSDARVAGAVVRVSDPPTRVDGLAERVPEPSEPVGGRADLAAGAVERVAGIADLVAGFVLAVGGPEVADGLADRAAPSVAVATRGARRLTDVTPVGRSATAPATAVRDGAEGVAAGRRWAVRVVAPRGLSLYCVPPRYSGDGRYVVALAGTP